MKGIGEAGRLARAFYKTEKPTRAQMDRARAAWKKFRAGASVKDVTPILTGQQEKTT